MNRYLFEFLVSKSHNAHIVKVCRSDEHKKYFNTLSYLKKGNSCFARNYLQLLSCHVMYADHNNTRFNFSMWRFASYVSCNSSCKSSTDFFTIKYLNLNQHRCMAGHAKWQNIKHTKESRDSERARLISRFVRLTKGAVREGGADPKYNTPLRNILEEARKYSIPSASLESAMKKSLSAKTKCGFLEIPGPEGIHIIVEYETENVGTFRHAVKQVLRGYQTGILSGEGRWRASYEQKGIVKVVGKNDDAELNAEQALDSAIEAGAEDVQLRSEDKMKFLEFICDPTDLHSVKKELELMGYKIEEAYVAFVPINMITLSGEAATVAGNLLSELEGVQDVVRLYENMQ